MLRRLFKTLGIPQDVLGVPPGSQNVSDPSGYLKKRAQAVADGKLAVDELVTDLYSVPDYPQGDAVTLLIDVLSKKKVAKELLRILTQSESPTASSDPENAGKSAQVVSYVFSNLPVFRELLLNDDEFIILVLSYFETTSPLPGAQTSYVTDVLSALVRENRAKVQAHFERSPSHLSAMVRHVSHFGVADFLLQVLTSETYEDVGKDVELRTTKCFKLLEAADFHRSLQQQVLDAMDRIEEDESAGMTVELGTYVLEGVDSYVIRAPKSVRALPCAKSLNPLVNAEQMYEMLEKSSNMRSVDVEPFLCVLGLWIDLLVAVYYEKKNMLHLDHKATAGSMELDTSKLERECMRIVPALMDVVREAEREATEARQKNEEAPRFGRMRLKVVEFLVTLLKTFGKEPRQNMYDEGLPEALFKLAVAWPANSLLHNLVAIAMEVSVCPQRPSGVRAWLTTFRLPRRIMDIWADDGDRFFQDSASPAYLSLLVKMALFLKTFLEKPNVVVDDLLPGRDRADFEGFTRNVLNRVLEMRIVPDDERVDRSQMTDNGYMFVRSNTLDVFNSTPTASTTSTSSLDNTGPEKTSGEEAPSQEDPSAKQTESIVEGLEEVAISTWVGNEGGAVDQNHESTAET